MDDTVKNPEEELSQEEEDLLDGIITLDDEDGNPVDFEVLDYFEHKGVFYTALLPADEEEAEDNGVLILQITPDPTDPEMELYSGVEDEKLLDEVYQVFKERNKEIFTFED